MILASFAIYEMESLEVPNLEDFWAFESGRGLHSQNQSPEPCPKAFGFKKEPRLPVGTSRESYFPPLNESGLWSVASLPLWLLRSCPKPEAASDDFGGSFAPPVSTTGSGGRG